MTLTTHSLRSAAACVEQFLGQIRRIEDRLRAAFAVADVNKDQAAEVAAGMDPAGQRDGLPDVCRAQFVAMMRAFHEFNIIAAPSERQPSVRFDRAVTNRR